MAQLARHSLCKHEVPRSNPREVCKRLDMVAGSCNPSSGEVRQEDPQAYWLVILA